MWVEKANPSHSLLLFNWRNDKDTRNASINTDPISFNSHQKWYESILANEQSFILIGYVSNGEAIGMCRFTFSETSGESEVSINLNPSFRGKGLSSSLLKQALNLYSLEVSRPKSIIAVIKAKNLASIRIFEKAGFILFESNMGLLTYKLTNF